MATIKTILEGVEERNEEIRLALISLTNGKTAEGKTLKENTVSTMRHHMKRDQRMLTLIKELATALDENGIKDVKLSEASLQGFNQVCFPEKGGSKVVVEEGDNLLDIMQKYSEVKDLLAKVTKAAEKIGCKPDFAAGKIIKA